MVGALVRTGKARGSPGGYFYCIYARGQSNLGKILIFGPKRGGVKYLQWDATTAFTRAVTFVVGVGGASDVPTIQNFILCPT